MHSFIDLSIIKKIFFTFVSVAIISAGIFLAISMKQDTDGDVACTMEARLCPDGSAVGRTGPNCEFASCPSENLGDEVKLYYYNPELDKDIGGNIMCSRAGLVPVSRILPKTQNPIRDTIELLLSGEISPEEKAQGITTEFPLPDVTLTGADIKNGILTLSFTDLENRTSGGSCRVGILWFQIEATAKQFQGISGVRFLPEELFQP